MKTKGVAKLYSFEHIHSYSSTRADLYSSCGVVVINTAQLHSTKPELRFCAGSNPARGMSEIRDGEDLRQWFLHAFRRSTIPQKQFIIIIFSYPCWSRWFIFTKQIIVLFWVIIYSYLQRFFKISVLKILYTIHRKITVSESLLDQSVACYFFNKRFRHRHFLVDITKLSRTPFLQEHPKTTDSVFMEDICYYKIIKFNAN